MTSVDGPAPQSPFLRLPAELRYQILHAAVCAPRRPAPRSPAAAQAHRLRFYNRAAPAEDRGTSIYVEERDPCRAVDSRASTALTLRLASRQLRNEVGYILERVVPELDVMFVSGIGIMPTWLSRAPVCPRRIPRLRVHVRASDSTQDMYRAWKLYAIPFAIPNGSGKTFENQAAFFSIYLLQSCASLARPGPAGYAPPEPVLWGSRRPRNEADPAEHAGFGSEEDHLVPWPTIGSIVVNVEAPGMKSRCEEFTPSPVFGVEIFTGDDAWPDLLKKPDGVPRPRAGCTHKLAASFTNVLRDLLHGETNRWEPYSMYLFMNVGRIDIQVEGETLASIDIGAAFREKFGVAIVQYQEKLGDPKCPEERMRHLFPDWVYVAIEKRARDGI